MDELALLPGFDTACGLKPELCRVPELHHHTKRLRHAPRIMSEYRTPVALQFEAT